MKDFHTLTIWQLSHQFTLEIYRVTAQYPKDELFALVSQMRRSSSSIPTNIAEGCGRGTDADFAHFLQIALGSASEIEYQILLSADLNYISREEAAALTKDIIEIKKMLVSFITKVRGSILRLAISF